MKLVCKICKQCINDNFRIDVYLRDLGRLKIVENYHLNCWNKYIALLREKVSV